MWRTRIHSQHKPQLTGPGASCSYWHDASRNPYLPDKLVLLRPSLTAIAKVQPPTFLHQPSYSSMELWNLASVLRNSSCALSFCPASDFHVISPTTQEIRNLLFFFPRDVVFFTHTPNSKPCLLPSPVFQAFGTWLGLLD